MAEVWLTNIHEYTKDVILIDVHLKTQKAEIKLWKKNGCAEIVHSFNRLK